MNEAAVDLKSYVGRKAEAEDVADLRSMRQLHAALDRSDAPPREGDEVPPAWHWMWFNATDRHSALSRDGIAGAKGGFMPPSPLPRRMWAGSQLTVHRALRVGEKIRRTAEIVSVEERQGKSGRLVFVGQRFSIRAGNDLAIEEDFQSVFREDPKPGAPVVEPPQAPSDGQWTRTIDPDPVLLFRYSAVTYNGHRIHYDRPYTTQVEGYPDLIVHGPLTATLLMELARDSNPGKRIAKYNFRAVSPLYSPAKFIIAGKPGADGKSASLWAANPQGQVAMQAEVTFA
jgi:3-methylfumaryl-CoA hydratase